LRDQVRELRRVMEGARPADQSKSSPGPVNYGKKPKRSSSKGKQVPF